MSFEWSRHYSLTLARLRRIGRRCVHCPAATVHGATLRVNSRQFKSIKKRCKQGGSREASVRHAARHLLFVGASLHGISSVAAQDWPNKPVRIVNTFAPGGAADYLARTVADNLTNAFGQQFFVETRSGAAGAIGVNSVVATPPDGYNFVITNITMLVLAPISQSEARLSSGTRPHQHRLSRRLAGRAVGQCEEPHQDARRFRRATERRAESR